MFLHHCIKDDFYGAILFTLVWGLSKRERGASISGTAYGLSGKIVRVNIFEMRRGAGAYPIVAIIGIEKNLSRNISTCDIRKFKI